MNDRQYLIYRTPKSTANTIIRPQSQYGDSGREAGRPSGLPRVALGHLEKTFYNTIHPIYTVTLLTLAGKKRLVKPVNVTTTLGICAMNKLFEQT